MRNKLKKQTVFVTGASGFIGRHLVQLLLHHGYKVRAGVHHLKRANKIDSNSNYDMVQIDICNKNSLRNVFKGVDYLYHFAASVNSKLSIEELHRTNVEGTRNVWEAAYQAHVKKALYCSSTAVYGLLSQKETMITEESPARAIEPYGKSKLEGEKIVIELSKDKNIKSIIIRPTAVFGPAEHTLFGRELHGAAYSKLLLSGGFKDKKFSYIHVIDVVEAAIHLMAIEENNYQIYNTVVDQPITYEEAFKSYLRALEKAGYGYLKHRLLGKISLIIEKIPGMTQLLCSKKDSRYVFGVWKPGFDLTYSAQRLLSTSYQLKWNNFEDVIASCI